MHDYLRVHILELQSEAKIIKNFIQRHLEEGRKAQWHYKEQKAQWHYHHVRGMHEHRKNVVRPASRSTQLALGLLTGKKYQDMEAKARTMPDWKQIRIFAMRFYDTFRWPDPSVISDIVNKWICDAIIYYNHHKIGDVGDREMKDQRQFFVDQKLIKVSDTLDKVMYLHYGVPINLLGAGYASST